MICEQALIYPRVQESSNAIRLDSSLRLHASCVILFEPFDPCLDVAVHVSSPTVAAVVGRQLYRCAALVQLLGSLLRHPKWTGAVIWRVVEEVAMPFGFLELRQVVRLENGHGDEGSGDFVVDERCRVCGRSAR